MCHNKYAISSSYGGIKTGEHLLRVVKVEVGGGAGDPRPPRDGGARDPRRTALLPIKNEQGFQYALLGVLIFPVVFYPLSTNFK